VQPKNRNARQSFLGPQMEEVLSTVRVAIVGLCGGGSHIAQQLAHVGVQNYCLIDPDSVDETNLNRMVGSEPDDAELSRNKTDVIRRAILRIQPSATIKTVKGYWEENHIALRDCDFVFGCVDKFRVRADLETYCRRFLIPYIDLGMDVIEHRSGYSISGQVVLSLPDHHCMRCLGFLTDELIAREVQRYGAAGNRPQVIWSNGQLASAAVGMFIKSILPWTTTATFPYLEYDGNTQLLHESNLAKEGMKRPCNHFQGTHDLGEQPWNGIAMLRLDRH